MRQFSGLVLSAFVLPLAFAVAAHADTLVRFTFTLNTAPALATPVYANETVYADIYQDGTFLSGSGYIGGFGDPDSNIASNDFLNYVNAGSYDGSFINRSVPGLLQGGDYQVNGGSIASVPAQSAVSLAGYSGFLPNLAGTIAMVPTGDALTGRFLFNTRDNSAFTYPVIGRVLNSPGMTAINAIAALNTINDSANVPASFASDFFNLPLTDPDPSYPDFVNITSVAVVGKMGDINGDGQIDIDDFLLMDESILHPPASLQANDFAADWAQGDLNLDGVVDLSDVALLNEAYFLDHQPSSVVVVSVPEPASLLSFVIVGLALSRLKRQRCAR